jgi:hypothetical protein
MAALGLKHDGLLEAISKIILDIFSKMFGVTPIRLHKK